MGKMCRLKPEASAAFALQDALPVVLQAAAQQGIPINDQTTQMLRGILLQGLTAGLSELQRKYGIFTGIADDSPYFQHFGAHALVNAAMTNIRPIANVNPAPPAMPAPVFVQPQQPQQPQQIQQPWAGHSHIPPPPSHAIMPGQPLPANLSPQPQHPQQVQHYAPPPPMPAGSRPIPAHAVPVHAPVMNGDHPPSLTQPPSDPTPTIS